MVFKKEITIWTENYNEFIELLPCIEDTVSECGIRNGMVSVISNHTTTGVMVNENLECLLKDIDIFLERLIPEGGGYNHARMLHEYGSTAGNPTGHLKSLICGNHCHLVLTEGRIDRGGAQEVFFCEFDGPARRSLQILVIGD